MTSASINTFVGDLVAMAQAMERLPQVEAELAETKSKLDAAEGTIGDRELSILNYKQRIDELHAKVRSLEVERDDAAFRALELEEKVSNAVGMFSHLVDLASEGRVYMDPPKPEPVAEPVTMEYQATEVSSGQSEPLPTPPNGVTNIPITESGTETSNSTMEASQSHPAKTDGSTISSSADASPDTPTLSEPRPLTATETDAEPEHRYSIEWYDWQERQRIAKLKAEQPYAGKRYVDFPAYVTLSDWLAGGGSEEDYHSTF